MRSSAWANLAVVHAKEGKGEDGVAAYLLAYKFSKNSEKTRELLTSQSQSDPDPRVKDLAVRVLQAINQGN